MTITRSFGCILCATLLPACPWFGEEAAPFFEAIVDPAAPPPDGARYAFVFADNADPGFSREAKAMTAALRKRGFTTHATGEAAGQPEPLAALSALEATVKAGDRVLIDVQTHGGDLYRHFTNPDTHADEWTTFGFGAKWYESYPGIYYPTSPDLFGSHAMAVFDATNGKTHWLSPSALLPNIRRLRALGARVAVIDHSCNAGATLRYFSAVEPGVCVIATAGAMGPSITGYPALSADLPKLDDLAQAAAALSEAFYTGTHTQGRRTHQRGFSTSCDATMATRDALDMTSHVYGTWWHWMRYDATLVVREPSAFTALASIVEPAPLGVHADFAVADGWVSWLAESVPTTASGQAAHSVTIERAHAVRSSLVALRESIMAHGLDTFLRDSLVADCACAGLDCATRDARRRASAIYAARAELRVADCADPRGYTSRVLAAYPEAAAAYQQLVSDEASLVSAVKLESEALRDQERLCRSTTCGNFRL